MTGTKVTVIVIVIVWDIVAVTGIGTVIVMVIYRHPGRQTGPNRYQNQTTPTVTYMTHRHYNHK